MFGGEDQMGIIPALEWVDDNHLTVAGTHFYCTVDPNVYHSRKSGPDGFLLVKSRAMVETTFAAIRAIEVRNIVDIGVWQGGSVALLDAMCRPEKLVALEYNRERIATLDAYIAQRRSGRISLIQGINQADSEAVKKVVNREFGARPIDLVIDDASHQYAETVSSFNVLFPRLRPGGLFIIEDWQWSMHPAVAEMDYFKGKPSLSNLVVQCMFLCALRPDLISTVAVNPNSVFITRGPAAEVADFDIGKLATNRGAPVPVVL